MQIEHIIQAIRSRPLLSSLIQVVAWPGDLLIAFIILRGRSCQIDRNLGLPKMLGVPLLAWINYHRNEMSDARCKWMGQRALKNPMDCWIYQEIIYEVKPDLIIEFGNKNGGSTLFLAGLCELMGHGRIVAVDKNHSQFTARHPKIELITGDCGSEETITAVRTRCQGQKVLIIHDADHSREAVLRDLRNYADLVSLGSYFIVEDTIGNMRGYGGRRFLIPKFNTAAQAINKFLKETQKFNVDQSRERYILTYNHGGFLQRVADSQITESK